MLEYRTNLLLIEKRMVVIMLINFVRGFCMALADSVPGVSGGTIAFLLGFYDKFIGSLDALVSGNKQEKIKAIKFLIKIGIGWIFGFCMAILFITAVFESNIYEISSLFIGFIIFALPIIILEEKECLKNKFWGIIFVFAGAAVVVAISYFSGETLAEGINLAMGEFSVGTGIFLFFAGAIAISAMVLPGISGSTILMIFGLYIPITNAIKEFLHLNFVYVPALFIFGIGVIVGALSVVKMIKKALVKFRAQTVYLIIGLMVGSVYSIILGPKSLDVPKEAMSFDTFSIIFFIIGGIVIWGLQFMKMKLNKSDE